MRTAHRQIWLSLTLLAALAAPSAVAAELTDEQKQAIFLLLRSEPETSVEVRADDLIALGSSIQLRSSISGGYYTYQWTQTGGPAATLSGLETPVLSVTLDDLADPTEFSFELSVSGPAGELLVGTYAFTAYPNEAPELAVDFPCPGCRMYATTISFRGTTNPGADEDPVLSADAISLTAAIGSTSVAVPIEDDGSWQLDNLAIPANVQQVTLTAVDAFGATRTEQIVLENKPTLDAPVFAVDPAENNVVYALETDWVDRFVRIDLTSAERTVLYELREFGIEQVFDMVALPGGDRVAFAEVSSGRIGTFSTTDGTLTTLSAANVGTGQTMSSPSLIDLDVDDARLVAYDFSRNSIFVIDVDSGDRTELITSVDTGGIAVDSSNDLVFYVDGTSIFAADLNDGSTEIIGTAPEILQDVHAYRSASNEILMGRFDGDRLYATSVSSGTSNVLSDSSSGIALDGIPDVHYDALSDRYLAVDFAASNIPDTSSLVAIHPTTGDRTEAFSDRVGSGPNVEGQGGLALRDGSTAYLATQTTDNLVAIDLASGDKSLISDDDTGFGPTLEVPTAVLYSDSSGLLILDATRDAVLSVNLGTGDRSVVSGSGTGSGPAFSEPFAMTFNEDASSVYVVDNGLNQVLAVDLGNGNRTVVSDNGNAGPALEETYGIALDTTNSRLIIGEQSTGSTFDLALVAISLDTGDRSRLAAYDVGTGPNILSFQDLVVTGDGTTAYVSSGDRVFEVDLATGNRTVLADATTGSGDVLANLGSLALDAGEELLYGWNSTYESMVIIDLSTGERVIRSR